MWLGYMLRGNHIERNSHLVQGGHSMWLGYLLRGSHTERYGHLVQGGHSMWLGYLMRGSHLPARLKTDPTGSASRSINTSASLGTAIAAAGIAGKGRYPEFG